MGLVSILSLSIKIGSITDELQSKIILNSEGIKENTTLYPRKIHRGGYSNPNKVAKQS